MMIIVTGAKLIHGAKDKPILSDRQQTFTPLVVDKVVDSPIATCTRSRIIIEWPESGRNQRR